MNKSKSNKRREKIGALAAVIVSVALLAVLFFMKDNLDEYVSESVKSLTNDDEKKSAAQLIDSLYNYVMIGSSYETTFLEFGAKGCVACRKMEFVLDEVRQKYPGRVKVVFLNILQPQNQDLMKYYGIVAIPTQVLLDENGEEYFRHTGYYSFEDLRKVFENKLAYDQ